MEATVYLFSISLRPPDGSEFNIHFDHAAGRLIARSHRPRPRIHIFIQIFIETLFIEVKLYGGTGTDFSWRYRNTLILNFNTKIYRSKLHRAEDCLGWLSIIS